MLRDGLGPTRVLVWHESVGRAKGCWRFGNWEVCPGLEVVVMDPWGWLWWFLPGWRSSQYINDKATPKLEATTSERWRPWRQGWRPSPQVDQVNNRLLGRPHPARKGGCEGACVRKRSKRGEGHEKRTRQDKRARSPTKFVRHAAHQRPGLRSFPQELAKDGIPLKELLLSLANYCQDNCA